MLNRSEPSCEGSRRKLSIEGLRISSEADLAERVTSTFQVTLNYRRQDTAGHAGRLYDSLAERFGSEHVFIDIDKIDPGIDFADAINRAIGSADAFICLIGAEWLTSTDVKGRRRLENPEDLVRLEIEAALSREIRVIPVLVQGAEMPQSDQLPESLARLARRNAIELRDSSWHQDVGRLIRTLEKIDLENVDADETRAADRQPPIAKARKPRVAARKRVPAERAIPSHSGSREPPASPPGSPARIRRVVAAHKVLVTVGGVAALIAAVLVVPRLLAPPVVRMTSVGGQSYDAQAHRNSDKLTLQVTSELTGDGRPLKFAMFNKWAKRGERPADASLQKTLTFSEKDANVAAGGLPYTDVRPPEDYRRKYKYFGITKIEPADKGVGRLVLWARVADLF